MTLVDIPHEEFSKQLCCFTSLPFKCEARTLINLSRWDMFLLFHTAVEIKLQGTASRFKQQHSDVIYKTVFGEMSLSTISVSKQQLF